MPKCSDLYEDGFLGEMVSDPASNDEVQERLKKSLPLFDVIIFDIHEPRRILPFGVEITIRF